MNKIISTLFSLVLLCSFGASSQTPVSGVRWKRFIGSDKFEGFTKIIPANDNGYLLIGVKNSYPESGGYYSYDLLVVKVNEEGYMEWQKTYGGSGSEVGYAGIATPDNGFLIAGTSTSYKNDGDVTGHHDTSTIAGQGTDVWVTKINQFGELQWAKTYGGIGMDEAKDIVRSSDGNYVIAATTDSWDGDLLSIRHTETRSNENNTSLDAWLFKINDTGNIVWQQCYGGNAYDQVNSIAAAPNNEIVAVGKTSSVDHDLLGVQRFGSVDGWMFKVNASGSILINKAYGGAKADELIKIAAYNNTYYIAGTSSSDDEFTANCGVDTIEHSYNIVLLQIDAGVNIIWRDCNSIRKYVGVNDLAIVPGNGIYLLGLIDFTSAVLRKFDFSNNIESDTELGNSYLASISPIGNKQLYFAGAHSVDTARIQPRGFHGGGSDGILLRYGDVNIIKGHVFLDVNANGIKDPTEQWLNQVKVTSSKQEQLVISLSKGGQFSNDADTGTYVTTVVPINQNYQVLPLSHISTFNSYYNVDSLVFAMQPLADKKDLTISLLPITAVRPGLQAGYQLQVINTGTVTADTVLVKLVKSQQLALLSTDRPYTTTGDTIYWSLSNMQPLDTATIHVQLRVAAPPMVNLGDTLKLLVRTLPVAGDITPNNNADTLKQLVTGSFDPNDKTESHGGFITPEHVADSTPLTYLIRFQNTGSDTAFSVVVADTLENRLDWNSFEMIGASHPYQLNIADNHKLTWIFDNILLPDSNINESASHGYIAYRIKPRTTVIVGDTIHNTAAIYFDYNLPVWTNMQKTAIVSFSALPVGLLSFKALLNGEVVNLNWKTATEHQTAFFEVQRSGNGVEFTVIGTVQAKNMPLGSSYSFKDEHPLTGYNHYRLRIVDINRSVRLSPIAIVNVKAGNDIVTAIYPNPTDGQVMIDIRGNLSGSVQVTVIDPAGRVVFTRLLSTPDKAAVHTPLLLGRLPKGLYTLRFTNGSDSWLHRLIVK